MSALPSDCDGVLAQVRQLDAAAQRRLLGGLTELVEREDDQQPMHSLRELCGRGKEIWEDRRAGVCGAGASLVDKVRAPRGRVLALDTAPLIYSIADYADDAERLRATHHVAAPDAIQFATALTEGADAFLMNDHRLPRLAALPYLLISDL